MVTPEDGSEYARVILFKVLDVLYLHVFAQVRISPYHVKLKVECIVRNNLADKVRVGDLGQYELQQITAGAEEVQERHNDDYHKAQVVPELQQEYGHQRRVLFE